MNIETMMKERKQYVERKLEELIPSELDYPEIIFKAMRYSVFAGGKRLRPILLLEANRLMGGRDEDAAAYACAIEMIHTYSLIHDDLPALDNDNFRRGRLTSHKAFGENIAILAGDALLNHAFTVMSREACEKNSMAGCCAMNIIASHAGVDGMIGGQVVDVISEGKQIDKETLDYIHLNKTAALIKCALRAGGIFGGASEESGDLLSRAGEKMGIAFQIQDDILDVTGKQEELGKPVLSDERNEKVTYVTLYGVEESKEIVRALSREAVEIFESFGKRSAALVEITKSLIDRKM